MLFENVTMDIIYDKASNRTADINMTTDLTTLVSPGTVFWESSTPNWTGNNSFVAQNCSREYEESKTKFLAVTESIASWLFIGFYPACLVNNIVPICIFVGKGKTASSLTTLLKFLHVSNILYMTSVLCLLSIINLPVSLLGDNHESESFCKAILFLIRVFMGLSSWIQMLLATLQAMIIVFPTNFVALRKNSTIALVTLGVLLVISIGVNIEIISGDLIGVLGVEGHYFCILKGGRDYFNYIGMILPWGICFLAASISIAVNQQRARKLNSKKSIIINVFVATSTLVFIAFTLPFVLFQSIGFSDGKCDSSYMGNRIFEKVSNLGLQVYYSSACIVYAMASKPFRRNVIATFVKFFGFVMRTNVAVIEKGSMNITSRMKVSHSSTDGRLQ